MDITRVRAEFEGIANPQGLADFSKREMNAMVTRLRRVRNENFQSAKSKELIEEVIGRRVTKIIDDLEGIVRIIEVAANCDLPAKLEIYTFDSDVSTEDLLNGIIAILREVKSKYKTALGL